MEGGRTSVDTVEDEVMKQGKDFSLSLCTSRARRLKDSCCSCESAAARQINSRHYLPRYQVLGPPLFSIGRVRKHSAGFWEAPAAPSASAPSTTRVRINTHCLDVIQPRRELLSHKADHEHAHDREFVASSDRGHSWKPAKTKEEEVPH